ncbi:hypothetical protein [Cyanobium sp. NIES-981]|uniref:hypothetical protein n=1 Tax=Cyanobium sp. NIES-981 TaxID=1851505 RepID=UPI00350F0197
MAGARERSGSDHPPPPSGGPGAGAGGQACHIGHLALVLLVFQLLYAITAPLQELLAGLLDGIQNLALDPALAAIGAPEFVRGLLIDGVWLGLDGRAFVLQVMGFGCNVPSILGTRVIRDRGMRLLAMLCIPFALCQARLTVYLFLVGVFFPRPWWAPGLVLFGFYLLSFRAGCWGRDSIRTRCPALTELSGTSKPLTG